MEDENGEMIPVKFRCFLKNPLVLICFLGASSFWISLFLRLLSVFVVPWSTFFKAWIAIGISLIFLLLFIGDMIEQRNSKNRGIKDDEP